MKSLLALLIILLVVANSLIIGGITQSTQQINVYTDLMLGMGKMQSEISLNAKGISKMQSTLAAIQKSTATLQEEIKQIAFKPQPQSRQRFHQVQSQQMQFQQVQFQEELLDESPVFFEASSSDMPFSEEKSPDEYWQEIRKIASERKDFKFNRGKREQFLETGAKLVRKLEGCEMNYFIDSESLQFFEAKLEDEGIDAINALYVAKKELAGYLSEAKQYRRELDAMLEDTQPLKFSKISSYAPPPKQLQQFYHPKIIDNTVLRDGKGNYLIHIKFYRRFEDKDGILTFIDMTDTVNLKSMRSLDHNFFYPQHFTSKLYALLRKMVRDHTLIFNPRLKDSEIQKFLTLIS